MIIELFGPPAVGKSTLANALAAALRYKGFEVALSASARPNERDLIEAGRPITNRNSNFAIAAPLLRAAKFAGTLRNFNFQSQTADVGSCLLKLLPPKTWATRLRLRLYLKRLANSFDVGRAFPGITVIDQGYVTALCSLAVRTRAPHSLGVALGLGLLPKPDLLIVLDVQNHVLHARLADRRQRQNAIERLFEQDGEATGKQTAMVRLVAAMLAQQNWPIISFSDIEQTTLARAVEKIEQHITAHHISIHGEAA